jgi:GTP cyclohydrolase I
MGLLQAALGNLSQSQSAEQLKFNLQRVRKIYQEIVHGPSQSDADASLDDLLKKYGGQ